MKLERVLVAAAVVGSLCGPRAARAEGVADTWIETGRSVLGVAGFGSRILAAGSTSKRDDNSGWAPGVLASYGYAATSWLMPEWEAFLAVGRFTDHRFTAGGALVGATFYDPSASRVIPFAGLRLGIGRLEARNKDGGKPTDTTFVVAPKVGILVRLAEQIALQVSVEYRGNYLFDLDGYDYGHRHLIAVPIGVAFAL